MLALLDAQREPIDAYRLHALMASQGEAPSLSVIYRLLARLKAANSVLELRGGARRQFLSARQALRLRVEDPSGQVIDVPAPGLQVLLTQIAAERGLRLDGLVTIRFSD